MRMPILAYFVVVGTALLALLVLSSYELPDDGAPIKTSQLVGLPKVEPHPESEPTMTASANFAAPEKENQTVQSLNGIHAEQISAHKHKSANLTKRRAETSNAKSGRERRVALYSHDAVMGIH